MWGGCGCEKCKCLCTLGCTYVHSTFSILFTTLLSYNKPTLPLTPRETFAISSRRTPLLALPQHKVGVACIRNTKHRQEEGWKKSVNLDHQFLLSADKVEHGGCACAYTLHRACFSATKSSPRITTSFFFNFPLMQVWPHPIILHRLWDTDVLDSQSWSSEGTYREIECYRPSHEQATWRRFLTMPA